MATEIISSDGKTLGKFYFNDNRTPVDYTELSQNLVDALVATEDTRYHDHAGIDGRGTVRAFAFLGKRGGASTISQQLARQLFVGVSFKSKKYHQCCYSKNQRMGYSYSFRKSIHQGRNYCHVFSISMILEIMEMEFVVLLTFTLEKSLRT